MNAQAVWDHLDALKLSQNDLARQLGLSQGYLSQLINGTRFASPRIQRRFQRALGDVELDELFTVVDPDPAGASAKKRRLPAVKRKRDAHSTTEEVQTSLAAILPPGTSALPSDFPDRLERLKKASGLTWNQLGEKVGVDPRQLIRWRGGSEPSGGAMLSLIRLTQVLPEGQQMLFGDVRQSGRRRSPRKDGR